MTMEELEQEYTQSAHQVQQRIGQLRRQVLTSQSPQERHQLRLRILSLQPLYRDTREISTIINRYNRKRRVNHDTTSQS